MSLVTISGLLSRLEAGETTATALLSDLQSRITARGTLSPFQRLEWERAFEQADLSDRARRERKPLGPLAGVPMAHKDMFDRKGSTVGFGGHPSARKTAGGTAPVLERLDAAGAVDFGRLQMSEFAMGPTGQNHHYGMPENPAVPGGVPGGSSSGSGVAVGMGLVPAALGSDTGGSIRVPAACNGVVGFKPGLGLVPLDRAMPLSWTQDTVGPLAASVDCARRVLSVISGGKTRAHGETPRKLRIAFDRGGFVEGISDRMRAALAETRGALAGQGHDLVSLDMGFFADLTEPANVIAIAEAATVHADRLRDCAETYGTQVRARLAQAAGISAQAYLRARQIREIAMARTAEEIFGAADLVILPGLADVAPQAEALVHAEGAEIARMISGMTGFTRPGSILGLPVLSLPVAWTSDGPLSLQIMGPRGSEDLIADLAQTLETSRQPVEAALAEPA